MVFKISIFEMPDHEINFTGDDQYLNPILETLSPICSIHGPSNGIYLGDGRMIMKRCFNFGLKDLSKEVGKQSVLNVLLNLIDKDEVEISVRDKYLFKYWEYEMHMIEDKKSFRSVPDKLLIGASLTTALSLNEILNTCNTFQYLPGFEQLFLFLENSKSQKEAMEYTFKYNRPQHPLHVEIDEFICKDENNLFPGMQKFKACGKSQLLFFARKKIRIIEDYEPIEIYRQISTKKH